MIKNATHKRQAEAGFTLVELSIVLVIIGLIVGGVLVGQALIEAARVRAAMSQIDGFNAAINTFRSKYNGLPGDLSTDFGIGGAQVTGNGNGVVDDGQASVGNTWAGELPQVWAQLSQESLINGTYDGTTEAIGTGYPAFRLGQGGVIVGFNGSRNYYRIAEFSGDAEDYDPIISAASAFQIDQKFDDGLANAGVVQAQGAAFYGTAYGATCADTTSGVYVVGSDTAICGLSIRVSG